MAKPRHGKASMARPRMASFGPKTLLFALPLALPVVMLQSSIQHLLPVRLQTYFSSSHLQTSEQAQATPSNQSLLEACYTHTYTTEIVSLDPLVIYINNFTSAAEAEELINIGEPDFAPSFISRAHTGANVRVSGRTSSSAPLPQDHPLVTCILSRARAFLGGSMLPDEPFATPQLVKYRPGEKYDLHTDFWPTHQVLKDGKGKGKLMNRPISFFVFLRDTCTGGETYFPLVEVDGGVVGDGKWEGRMAVGPVGGGGGGGDDDDGGVGEGRKRKGVRFTPITGNAVFWVNLDGEGRGDQRLVHAGLEVKSGEKVGMNIWARRFYGEVDDW
ncbi:uncharacterized protein EI97DRAFT_463647 [Westerdykella ornata]|uniref:Fe2OG dioxygenase domain-containing protein n=1 Tax=Westerdykella ornata TaxID=318751 RepID=A0A6A6JXE1_WESOR|nr:uncharacterized protein EI97DRAFT_463647 [Westerdykella ornata]KAF2281291.1 hypothetical protein EI97DRAFT_463647 [Westerdykella ornata]